MNKWIIESIEMANSKGYLDNLQSVYPAQATGERDIPKELMDRIKKAFDERDMKELVKGVATLAQIEKSPVEDSYLGSLKLDEKIIENNPETVKLFAKRILDLDWDEVVKRCNEPKKGSRRFGNSFKAWVKTIGYPSFQLDSFMSAKGTVFLDASDVQMQSFAENVLSCKLEEKGDVDFIAKLKNGKFVVGGAKFITDTGGGQTNQYFNIVKLSEEKSGKLNVIRIAIVDGVVWFKKSGKYYKRLCDSTGISLSALLLPAFIREAESG